MNLLVAPTDDDRKAICLDPLGYALYHKQQQFSDQAANREPTDNQIVKFPFAANSQFFIPRLRLSADPYALPFPRPVPDVVAGEICRFVDDLEFELPNSSSEQPRQIREQDQIIAAKRYAKGSFSWFATLVPPDPFAKSYILSVAIARNRNAFSEVPTSNGRVPEAVIPVANFATFDGTGELQLAEPPPEFLEPGHWLMVMNPGAGYLVTNGQVNQYEWYRVVSMADENITVSGADWNSLPSVHPAAVVIPPNVVAVYSKTVPLQITE